MQSTFQLQRTIRRWLVFFIFMLVVSGLTAIPLREELEFVKRFFDFDSTMGVWLNAIYDSLVDTRQKYPWLFYGYDWLAFAHVIIAIAFIGPYKDPVKNKWIIEFGMIACLLIIPFAMIAGYFRSIPFWWRLIDCSFGIMGMIPLAICYRKIHLLEEIKEEERVYEYSF
jgi:hypothetical protein